MLILITLSHDFFITADLRKTKETNKELRMNLEKKSKQLALEQQKSKSFLLDLARIRKVTAEELKNTVSLVSSTTFFMNL